MLKTAKPKSPAGRKPAPEELVPFAYKIPRSLRDRWDAFAERNQRTKTTLLRRALERYIVAEGSDEDH